jgi:hypothetical protein
MTWRRVRAQPPLDAVSAAAGNLVGIAPSRLLPRVGLVPRRVDSTDAVAE